MKIDAKDVCRECGAKCCKAGEIATDEAGHKKIIEAGFEDHFKKEKSLYYIVNHKKPCPYLKDNLCSIYDVRPLTCKCWPVFPIFDGKRRYVMLNCPLTKHLSKGDTKKLKEVASKIRKEVCELILEVDKKNVGQNTYDREMGWDDLVNQKEV